MEDATSPDRAKSFLSDHPDYKGGLLTEFKWVLEKLGVGYGITINPDGELGMDLEPGMVDQLRKN